MSSYFASEEARLRHQEASRAGGSKPRVPRSEAHKAAISRGKRSKPVHYLKCDGKGHIAKTCGRSMITGLRVYVTTEELASMRERAGDLSISRYLRKMLGLDK